MMDRSKLSLLAIVLAVAAIPIAIFLITRDSSTDKTKALNTAQREQITTTGEDYLTTVSEFLSDIMGCARTVQGPDCARSAFALVEAAGVKATTALRSLESRASGSCSIDLDATDKTVAPSVAVIRDMAAAARGSDFKKANDLAPTATDAVEDFSLALRSAQRSCAEGS